MWLLVYLVCFSLIQWRSIYISFNFVHFLNFIKYLHLNYWEVLFAYVYCLSWKCVIIIVLTRVLYIITSSWFVFSSLLNVLKLYNYRFVPKIWSLKLYIKWPLSSAVSVWSILEASEFRYTSSQAFINGYCLNYFGCSFSLSLIDVVVTNTPCGILL